MNGYNTTLQSFMKGKTFIVPRYQRDYDWRAESIEDLLGDLILCSKSQLINSKNNLFLGTFTFKKVDDSNYEIIDGQQRITTLVLLTLALKVVFMERVKENSDSHIDQKVIPAINDLFLNVEDNQGVTTGSKLLAAPKIRDFLSEICMNLDFDMTNYPKSLQKGAGDSKKIKRYIKHFYDELNKEDTPDLKDIWGTIQNCELLITEVNTDEEAFNLFEVLNARGKQLETGDLLKNHIFKELYDTPDFDKYADMWDDDIVSTLKKPSELVLMLRHYYFTKNGMITKQELYREIKELIKDNKMSMDDFIIQVSDYTDWHVEISSGNKDSFKDELFNRFLIRKYKSSDYVDHAERLYSSLAAMKLFNFKPVFPAIFSYLKRIQYFLKNDIYKKKKKGDKLFEKIEQLFEKLEIYHFINYKLGTKKISFIEKTFSEYAMKFGECDDMSELLNIQDDLLDKLKSDLDTKTDFLLNFQSLRFKPDRESKDLIRYIFHKFNISRTRKNRNTDSAIYDFDKSRQISIEHWAPISTPADKNYSKIHANISNEGLNSIGNLVVLLHTENASLGNKTPKEKGDIARQNLIDKKITLHAFVVDFLDKYEDKFPGWDEDDISNRTVLLGNEAYDKVWRF